MPGRKEPTERTCIVTRAALPVARLIRFVAGPDGAVVPDLRRSLPGRGVWVTADAEHVATAEKKRLFAKAFEGPVTAGPDLAAQVDRLLLAAAIGALSLARKAGCVIGGFGKVEAALGRGDVVALIHAAEAGADGVAKLAGAARRRFGDAELPVIRSFTGEDLDLAFGRTNVIHAALLAGTASANLLARVGDLVNYRGDGLPHSADGRSTDARNDLPDLSAGP